MEKNTRPPRSWIKGLLAGVMIGAVIIGGLGCLIKNYRHVTAWLNTLPYEVQGFPEGDVLLIGSSIMEYWRTSAADLGPLHTTNMGVGGTMAGDWQRYTRRMVKPFHPRTVVVYVGSNDINGRKDSKKGDIVAAELAELFTLLRQAVPGAQIYYISIVPSPARRHVWDEAQRCNALVAQMAEEAEDLIFIDAASALLTEDGRLMPELYRGDALHLNALGYERWTSAIRPALLGAGGVR